MSWLARLPLRLAPWLAAAGVAWLHRAAGRKPKEVAPAPPMTPAAWDALEPGRGRAARWPGAIPPLGWKDVLWRTWRQAGRHRLGAVAGGVTFYLLLATFPAVAAFVSIYGLFMDIRGVEQQLVQLSRVFPREALDLIGEEMLRLASQRQETLSAALAGSALVSVWSANAGMKALFDGLNVTYGEAEKRPYLRRTLITYAATLSALIFLILVTSLTVAAPVFLHSLGLHELRLWFAPIRWLVLYLLAAGSFALIYRRGPSRRPPRWRWVALGGAAAALVWMVGSLAFSTYLASSAHFGATYGSLGAMIGFMLWVWFTVMVILWGAELNAAVEQQTTQDTTIGPEAPIGARGAVMADTVGRAFTVSPREARDFLGRQVAPVTRFLGLGQRRDPPA
ncbi:MAG TPA: YihY/virulence factor BrkB family protein [Caulobacteraceae bacterium]|nr:YihY/virulence factor BrkB family protein [Caulobacteraceae bacterium]